MATHFLAKHSPELKSGISFSSAAIEALLTWDWPGNVRELGDAVVRIFRSSRGKRIEANDLRLRLNVTEMPWSQAKLNSFRSGELEWTGNDTAFDFFLANYLFMFELSIGISMCVRDLLAF